MSELRRRLSDIEGGLESEYERAADNAVRKVFAILGVDINKPESVEEFREDLRFGKRLRKASDHGTFVFIAAIVSALAYATWVGIVETAKGLK